MLIEECDLALRIGAKHVDGAGVPRLRHFVQDAVGVVDRRRHEIVGVAAGEAEHDSLIARALVLVARGVDPLGDVGRLLVQIDVDLGFLPMEAFLLVADLPDTAAHRLLHHLVGDLAGTPHLARQDHPVGGCQRLGRHPRIRVCREIQIDDGVGDTVAKLIGMPF